MKDNLLSCEPVTVFDYRWTLTLTQTFRSAGDVLHDIGSMLSDLTDELDAMLKLEKDD